MVVLLRPCRELCFLHTPVVEILEVKMNFDLLTEKEIISLGIFVDRTLHNVYTEIMNGRNELELKGNEDANFERNNHKHSA